MTPKHIPNQWSPIDYRDVRPVVMPNSKCQPQPKTKQRRFMVLLLVLLLPVLIAGCKIIAMEAMSRAMLLRVKFHGQVVDQHGLPVADARVLVTVAGGGLHHGDGGGYYTTDEEGRFVVKGRGQNLGIRAIEHPQVSKFLDVNGRINAFFVPYEAELRAGAVGNWLDHQKAKHPYVFRVWRVERFGPVFVERSPIFLPPDNRFYTYFIEDARYSDGEIKEGEKRWVRTEQPGVQAGGVLAVRCFRGSDGNGDPVWWRSGASWQMTFRAIEGGIRFIPEGEVYLNEAPETGYQQEISFGYQAGSEDYQRREMREQKLFLKAQRGDVYASLEIEMDPFSSQKYCDSVGELKYTLDGSRSLAVPQ